MFEYIRLTVAFPQTQNSSAGMVEVLVGFKWPSILANDVDDGNFEIIEVSVGSGDAPQDLVRYVSSLGRAKVIQQFFRDIPVNMMVDYAEVEFKDQ